MPGKGGKSRCYRYSGNALEIFEKFFGTDNPFIDVVDSVAAQLEGSMLGSAFGGSSQKPPKAPDDLTVICECTLEELYMGCMKKVEYERNVLGLDGKTTKKSAESIEVEIKPGQASDSIIKFPGKGHEAYSYPTCSTFFLFYFQDSKFAIADLLIKVTEVQHPKYKRKGNDLIYLHKISLYDALCAAPFEIETLDHRIITVSVDQIINPRYKKPILQEGMPIPQTDPLASLKKEKEKGTLWILFDIEFPTYLSEEKKLKLRDILTQ